jgi:hypothetical protein
MFSSMVLSVRNIACGTWAICACHDRWFIGGDGLVIDLEAALRRAQQAHHDVDQGALAAARCSDQADAAALGITRFRFSSTGGSCGTRSETKRGSSGYGDETVSDRVAAASA